MTEFRLTLPYDSDLISAVLEYDQAEEDYGFYVSLRDDVQEWCLESMQQPCSLAVETKMKLALYHLDFENDRDMILFKLRWM